MYSFEFVKGEGLQVKINKDELAELMENERKEDARLTNLEEKGECLSERQQGHKDTGMCESDFC